MYYFCTEQLKYCKVCVSLLYYLIYILCHRLHGQPEHAEVIFNRPKDLQALTCCTSIYALFLRENDGVSHVFKHLYCYPHNKWHFIRTSSQAFSTCTCISSVTELSVSPHLQDFVKISFLIPNIMKKQFNSKIGCV